MSIEDNEITDFSQIFEDHKSNIFRDPSVLSLDYVPKKLIGRTKEITELAKIFKPLDYKGYPFNALIFGKTGSGKTVVSKFLLQKLSERLQVKKEIMDHELKWVYVPCKSNCSTNAILYDIIKQIDPDSTMPKKGLALTYYYKELWRAISDQNVSLVIVLDEIDRVNDEELLYNISRAGEMHNLPDHHFLSTIGITNDLDFGKTLDSRTISSMSPKEYFFDPYNAEQIEAILDERAKIAFVDNAIPYESINMISVYAAQDHGDARKAIKHLKLAAAYAEDNGYSQILPEHVELTLESVDMDRVLEVLPNFPLHEKIVMLAILKLTNYGTPSTNSQAVTSVYNKMCTEIGKKPLHRTTIASKFGDFKMLGLIKTSSMRKGKGGGWKDIRMSVQSGKAVEEVLYNDDNLEPLRDFQLNFFNGCFD